MTLAGRRIDQILPNLSPGDAASDACRLFQAMLRQAGADSEIWSAAIHPELARLARRFGATAMRRRRPELVLLHHTTGSAIPGRVLASGVPFGLFFHNITPPGYFLGANDLLAGIAWRGLAELPGLVRRASVSMAASQFSANQLRAAGAAEVAIVPIPFDPASHALQPDAEFVRRFDDGALNLLFVGRLAPNKRQDELLQVFRHLSQGATDRPAADRPARLLLVGSPEAAPDYAASLRRTIAEQRLRNVEILGHVSDAARAACYSVADVFVCLSEHEGYGLPLMEAMHHGIPVVARDAAAVAETVGDGGIVVRSSDPAWLAALVRLVAEPGSLRERCIAAGRARAAHSSPATVAPRLIAAIEVAVGSPDLTVPGRTTDRRIDA